MEGGQNRQKYLRCLNKYIAVYETHCIWYLVMDWASHGGHRLQACILVFRTSDLLL